VYHSTICVGEQERFEEGIRVRIAIITILILLVSSAYATGQEKKPLFNEAEYPPADFAVTHQTVRRDTVEIVATQVKRRQNGDGNPYYCRAWVDIRISDSTAKQLVFPDIDPVGGSYGLFMPKEQPIPGYLFFEKYGDYDGRLYLVDTKGHLTNLKGGWFFLDYSKRFLFSEYVSDGPEITVFDLRRRRVIFNSEIPSDVDWYRIGNKYAFRVVDDVAAPPSAGSVQLKVLELQHPKLQDMRISERQLEELPIIESPVESEVQSYKDCEFR
jgi:hypothetical protein